MGTWAPPIVGAAAPSTGVTVLSLSDAQIEQSGRSRIEIPAGTYAGQDEAVITTSLPVVAYATTAMDEDTAYAITKAFWENKDEMAKSGSWWNGVTPETLSVIEGEIHPGAARYYDEAGIALSDAAR